MNAFWSVYRSLREGEHGWMLHARTVRVLWHGKHLVALWFKTRMEAETVKQSILNGLSIDDAIEGLKTSVLPAPPPRIPFKGRKGTTTHRGARPFSLVRTHQRGQRGWMLRRRRSGARGHATLLLRWFVDKAEAIYVRDAMAAGMTLDAAVAAMEARITAECA